jgi:hypothetical protein
MPMLDPLYKIRFMQIYNQAMAANFSSAESRDMASLELTGRLFNEENNQSDNQSVNQSEIRSNNYQTNGNYDSSRSPESSFVF